METERDVEGALLSEWFGIVSRNNRYLNTEDRINSHPLRARFEYAIMDADGQSPDTRSKTKLVVILGASAWPESTLTAKAQFANSADAFRKYALSPQGLSMNTDCLLDLFDSNEPPSRQIKMIGSFFEQRLSVAKQDSEPITDLLVYYVGHGSFAENGNKYILALRSTTKGFENASSLNIYDLAAVLKQRIRFARRYIILDCCFAGAAVKSFQGSAELLATRLTARELPTKGTCVLCSSGPYNPSIAQSGKTFTMFFGAFHNSLTQGNPLLGPQMSIDDIFNLTVDEILATYRESAVRPEIYFPDQSDGEIRDVQLFPNRSHREATEDRNSPASKPPVPTRAAPKRVDASILPLVVIGCRFSSTLETDPQLQEEAISSAVQNASDIVKMYSGVLINFTERKLVACFGIPRVQETDPDRAIRAAISILEDVKQRSRAESVVVQIGAHISDFIVRTDGITHQATALNEDGFTSTIFEIAAAAEVNTIAASSAICGRIRNLYELLPIDKSDEVKSKAACTSFAFSKILKPSDSKLRFEGGTAEQSSFVGRNAELESLKGMWQATAKGHGAAVLLSGVPGIGKSRLLFELVRHAGNSGMVMTSQCWPQYTDSSFYPITSQFRKLWGMSSKSPEDVQTNALRESIKPFSDQPDTDARNLGYLFSLSSAESLGVGADVARQMAIETLCAILEKWSQQRPILLAIEDLHWSDSSTLDLIELLTNVSSSTRLLLALTARPEFRPTWAESSCFQHFSLAPLQACESTEMIRNLSSKKQLSAQMVSALCTRCDGIPLYTEELTRMIINEQSDGLKASAENLSELDNVPDTLQGLILARLNLLSNSAFQVIQESSIFGRAFSYSQLVSISTLSIGEIDAGLDELIRANYLSFHGKPPHARYLASHIMISEAAYETMLKGKRKEYHERAASTLIKLAQSASDVRPEIIAHHLTIAGKYPVALDYWEKAGTLASSHSALKEAINFYQKALKVLARLPASNDLHKRELGVTVSLGGQIMGVYGYASPETKAIFERAKELCVLIGESDQIHTLYGVWQYYMVSGKLPAARKLAEKLRDLTASSNSTEHLLGHRAMATTVFLQGNLELCSHHTKLGFKYPHSFEENRSLTVSLGHEPFIAHKLYQAWNLWITGFADQAKAASQSAFEEAERMGHNLTTAFAGCYFGVILNSRGEYPNAVVLAENTIRICEAAGAKLWLAWARIDLGWALAGMGDFDGGIASLVAGIGEWQATGARTGLTCFPSVLADAYIRSDRIDEAITTLAQIDSAMELNDEHFYEAEICRLHGEIELRSSQRRNKRALEYFHKGIRIAEEQGAVAWNLRLRTSLSKHFLSQGDFRQASDTLELLTQALLEGTDTVDYVQAAAVLAESKTRLLPPKAERDANV
jgi:tetratricopeptide (TPR) repeat protein